MPGESGSRKVLVTGSAGRIGRAAIRALSARGHRIVGYDRVPTPGLPADRCTVGVIQDADSIARVIGGADCLIHLAATPDDARFPRGTPPEDSDNFLTELLPNNIVGTYRVMEAARKAGVPRVVLASTRQVIHGYLSDHDLPATAPVSSRPRYLCTCTKLFAEAVGQTYAVQHGIAVLAVRLGWCPRNSTQVASIPSVLSLVIGMAASSAAGPDDPTPGGRSIPLFNGKDTTGWRLPEQVSGFKEWTAKKNDEGKVVALVGKEARTGKEWTMWEVRKGCSSAAGRCPTCTPTPRPGISISGWWSR